MYGEQRARRRRLAPVVRTGHCSVGATHELSSLTHAVSVASEALPERKRANEDPGRPTKQLRGVFRVFW